MYAAVAVCLLEAVERAINLLRGFRIQQGSKVLVKPNICWGRTGDSEEGFLLPGIHSYGKKK